MIVYLFDNTLEGLLTSIFGAYSRQVFPDVPLAKEEPLLLFCDGSFTAISDKEKSGRVWHDLGRKLFSSALSCLAQCWLTEEPGTASLLFHYVHRAIDAPCSIETNFADPDALEPFRMWKRVDWECMWISQFIRFQKAADDTYSAAVEPKKNVLPLIVGHFEDCFADQCRLIYDIKRTYGYYYNLKEAHEVTLGENSREGHLMTRMLNESLMDKDKKLFQQPWKAYFKVVCIKERLNPRKYRQDMPVRC